jgi:hypothetical protein
MKMASRPFCTSPSETSRVVEWQAGGMALMTRVTRVVVTTDRTAAPNLGLDTKPAAATFGASGSQQPQRQEADTQRGIVPSNDVVRSGTGRIRLLYQFMGGRAQAGEEQWHAGSPTDRATIRIRPPSPMTVRIVFFAFMLCGRSVLRIDGEVLQKRANHVFAESFDLQGQSRRHLTEPISAA